MTTLNPETLDYIAADVAEAIASIDWHALAASIAAMQQRKPVKAALKPPTTPKRSNAASPARLAAATRHAHADDLVLAS